MQRGDPKVPTIFSKYTTAIIGPGEAIVLPKHSKEPDYEAEFAVVIGKGGRYISKDRWREHVFGYTNLNDVSARDFQAATSQWMIGKTFDTFAPYRTRHRHRGRNPRPARAGHSNDH